VWQSLSARVSNSTESNVYLDDTFFRGDRKFEFVRPKLLFPKNVQSSVKQEKQSENKIFPLNLVLPNSMHFLNLNRCEFNKNLTYTIWIICNYQTGRNIWNRVRNSFSFDGIYISKVNFTNILQVVFKRKKSYAQHFLQFWFLFVLWHTLRYLKREHC
jgi:hypothetical protein